MSRFFQFTFLLFLLSVAFSFNSDSFLSLPTSSSDIILPPIDTKIEPAKLLVLVPGGLVPNENYTLIAKSIQIHSSFKLWVGIPNCLANLCDPLDPTSFGLNAAIYRVITAVNSTIKLDPKDIFIFGHSLGAVGARHFIDLHPEFAGLGLFGTQYIGDHEDFKGTLGYPKNLSAFPLPLLALSGAIDSIPFTHAAQMLLQRENLDQEGQIQKVIVVIPKMDHSDFCQGFHVKSDIITELSREEAVTAIGEVTGSWLDLQVFGLNFGKMRIIDNYIEITKNLIKPFVEAMKYEQTQWCEYGQKILSGVSENLWESMLDVSSWEIVGSNSDLEHSHPNYTLGNNKLSINVPSYPYYEEIQNFSYSTLYSGARDIACKMISSERIANELNFKLSEQLTCKDVNMKAFELAEQIVSQYTPDAYERFRNQGMQAIFTNDEFTVIGPQWVFISSLNINSKTGEITSPDMYSPLDSWTYPGVRYCKFLSPARAVEYIMVAGLQDRYA